MRWIQLRIARQNRREITSHTGRCRKFWVYTIDNGAVTGKELLELSRGQAFHDSSPQDSLSLNEVQVLITGGMGTGLLRCVESKGIEALITTETILDKAVEAYQKGILITRPGEPHEHAHKQNKYLVP